jgi:hypothetical protein
MRVDVSVFLVSTYCSLFQEFLIIDLGNEPSEGTAAMRFDNGL